MRASAIPTASEQAVASQGADVIAIGRAQRANIRDWVRLARPQQWVKNAFVLSPLLFSGRLLDFHAQLAAFGAFATFCLLASAIYLGNDIVDADADRAHPTKRFRPIAAGRVPVVAAGWVAGGLLAGAFALAWQIGPGVVAVAVTYLVLNVAYSLRLKHVVIMDVFVVASFFILRLLAGTTAIGVTPSVWLLLCGGLLALYLGFTKRRHELTLLGDARASHRAVLSHYSAALLDQIAVVLLSTTLISYVMYTRESATAASVGSDYLSYSTVFVIYGVFRYLYLVHQKDGGSPTETLLTDRSLIVAVLAWLAYCGWIVYRPH